MEKSHNRLYVAGRQATSENTKTTINHVDASSYFENNVCEAVKEQKISLSPKKDDIFYNMDYKKRGPAVIFNHKYFDDLKLESRNGTEKDCESLKQTLHNLGFEVKIYNDLTLKQFIEVLDELSKYDFSDCDCFFICVLSHGLPKKTIYAKDVSYPIDRLLKPFTSDRCPTLAGKPRLFLIQACRGCQMDDGIDVQPDTGGNAYRIPLGADFLTAYSTTPGYHSWRDEKNGSWYIQTFCDEIIKYYMELDLTSILPIINRKGAYEFESLPSSSSTHRRKQIPYFDSLLTRRLRFSPENVENTGVRLQAHVTEEQPNKEAEPTKDEVDAQVDFMQKKRAKPKITISNKKEDIFYNTWHKRRGLAIVFNHKVFNDDLRLEPRMGTEKDCERLNQTLTSLGFEVQIWEDLEFKQLEDKLEQLSTNDFGDCDCLFICILSNGLEDEKIYAKDRTYSTDTLFERFTPDCCPTLAGKPKIFLIDAGRGTRLDDGVDAEVDGIEGQTVYPIPSYADYVIAYSTAPNHVSWRRWDYGSWFIQSVCKEIDENWSQYDLVKILSFAHRTVAFEFESKIKKDLFSCHKKQIPDSKVMLTKLLRF